MLWVVDRYFDPHLVVVVVMCRERGHESVNLTKIRRLLQVERVKLFCMHTSRCPFIKNFLSEPAPTSNRAKQLLIQPRCRFVEILEVVEEAVVAEEDQVLEVVVVSNCNRNQNCPAQIWASTEIWPRFWWTRWFPTTELRSTCASPRYALLYSWKTRR